MITCPKCSKDNQDHYKFCLGCGAELPRDAAPKPFSPQTPPQGMKAAQAPRSAPLRRWPRQAPASESTVAVTPGARRRARLRPRRLRSPRRQRPSPCAPRRRRRARCNRRAERRGRRRRRDRRSDRRLPAVRARERPVEPLLRLVRLPPRRRAAHVPRRRPRPRPPVEPAGGAMALTALRADGTEAGTFQLPPGGGTVGRETGGIFAGDSYLSPRHATFRVAGPGRAVGEGRGLAQRRLQEARRARCPSRSGPTTSFASGRRSSSSSRSPRRPPRPTASSASARPARVTSGASRSSSAARRRATPSPSRRAACTSVASAGDILFPEDGYVSGLHCRLSWDGQKLFLTDLGSSNGTFVRVARDRSALRRRAAHGPAALPRRPLIEPAAWYAHPRGEMSPQRTIRVVAAVLEKDGRYLITQRRATAVLAAHVGVSRRPRRGRGDRRAGAQARGAPPARRGDRRRQAHLLREPPLRALRRRPLPLRVRPPRRDARGAKRQRLQVGRRAPSSTSTRSRRPTKRR